MAEELAVKYRKNAYGALRSMDALSRLADAAVSEVERCCRWLNLLPGERLSPQVAPSSPEHYYFVVEGQVGVVRSHPSEDDRKIDLKIEGGAPRCRADFITFFLSGDCFSDGYLRTRASDLDCVALMETVLMAVGTSKLSEFLERYPEWAAALRERNGIIRDRFSNTRLPEKAAVQNFFLRQNYSFARTLKIIDLDRCIGCDGCERACADRHGVPRLERRGPLLGRFAFPIACRTCADHRCVQACGFDAIALLPSEEVKVNKDKCVGCRACYDACPNGVIAMVETPYTVKDFPNPMPNTDNDGRTNVPGLYLTGEAAGAALIKVAINSGVKAVEAISRELEPSRQKNGVLDVIIVGAGPGGLAAALACLEKGYHFKVFDKGHYASTIQAYPRHKVVMAEPAHIPLYGKLWLKNTTKEELIEKWGEIIRDTGLEIDHHEPVTKVVKGEDGLFDVRTPKAEYRARRVVLATGTRGAPRKLGVKGEGEPRVQYALTDPEAFAGKHVLVVGGGDSAVEAVRSLSDAGALSSTLSYRQEKFGRIKAANQALATQYETEGKIGVVLSSTVSAIEEGKVTLKVKGKGDVTLDNDVVFALLGADPPTKFFQEMGIEILEPGSEGMKRLAESRGTRFYSSKCDHCVDHSDQACVSACPTGAIFEASAKDVFTDVANFAGAADFDERRILHGIVARPGAGRFQKSAPWIALAALVVMTAIGIECFVERTMPERSVRAFLSGDRGTAAVVSFSSGQGFGFHLGVIGTLLMGLTALYPLHSRLGWLRNIAATRLWFGCHVWAGILGPAFVTYHTILKLDRWPSIAFWAMWLVVFSGSIGRYVQTRLRRSMALLDFGAEVRRSALPDRPSGDGRPSATSVTKRVKETWSRVAHNVRRAVTVHLERSASAWRIVHVSLTAVMFAVAAAHIVAALLYRAA